MDESHEALMAMLDRRIVRLPDGTTGTVWEVYRSIETADIRARVTDASGRVHHVSVGQITYSPP